MCIRGKKWPTKPLVHRERAKLATEDGGRERGITFTAQHAEKYQALEGSHFARLSILEMCLAKKGWTVRRRAKYMF